LFAANIIARMAAAKRKKNENPIFDSIRKPMPPPSQRFGEERPEERAHPAKRKVKHKKKIATDE
jgi:hypothetical protein